MSLRQKEAQSLKFYTGFKFHILKICVKILNEGRVKNSYLFYP